MSRYSSHRKVIYLKGCIRQPGATGEIWSITKLRSLSKALQRL